MSLSAKLDAVLDRFAVLEARMNAAAEGGDWVALSRDRAELAPVVEKIRALRAAQRDLAGIEQMLADPSVDA